jgi:hypothetical protein
MGLLLSLTAALILPVASQTVAGTVTEADPTPGEPELAEVVPVPSLNLK